MERRAGQKGTDMGSIDRESSVPFYHQLYDILRGDILSGRLKMGQRLPTEFERMDVYHVSRTTVRQTIAKLRKEGLVVVRPGKGTFVSEIKIEPELATLTGFAEDMQALGLTPSARVLGVETVKASELVADALKLQVGEPVTKITRIRLAEDTPVSYEFAFLRPDVGQKVAEENLEILPIFSIFENKYGLPLSDAVYRIGASRANQAVAQALAISRGAPIFFVERTTYAPAGNPVVFEQIAYRGDRFRYMMRLKRRHSDRW